MPSGKGGVASWPILLVDRIRRSRDQGVNWGNMIQESGVEEAGGVRMTPIRKSGRGGRFKVLLLKVDTSKRLIAGKIPI